MIQTNNDNFRRFRYDEIDSRFQTQSITEVAAFINSLTFPINADDVNTDYVPDTAEKDKNQLYQKTDTYLDDGTGRVSRGLRGLELLSKLCRGVNPADLFLFNNVIYASSPSAIKEANRDKLIEIVIANLGMTYVVQSTMGTHVKETEEFMALAYTIGYQVKSGTFNPDQYKTQVLRFAKKLTYLSTVVNNRNR